MSKKVLVLASSPRKGGNSDTLANEFAIGAREFGNSTDKIFLRDQRINYCTGCGTCFQKKPCPQKDDMPYILEAMLNADVIALATPVYFYTMNAQMKTMIDRCCSRYAEIRGKEFYFLLAAADTEVSAMKRTVESLRAFISCLGDAKERGIIYGVGAYQIGDLSESIKKQAYEMGRDV